MRSQDQTELPHLHDAESVRLEFEDVVLGGYAWWADGQAPAFILLHGWGEDAAAMAPLARRVRSRGWHAVNISLRGWRGSTGIDDYGLSAAHDIGRVLSWLRCRDVGPVALLGYSMGGLMAQLAAAEHRSLAGVVVVNAPAHLPSFYAGTGYDGVRRYLDATLQPRQWHQSSPLTHAHRIAVPLLVVTGLQDTMCPPEQARRVASAAPASRLLEIQGMGHAPSDADWEDILRAAEEHLGLAASPSSYP